MKLFRLTVACLLLLSSGVFAADRVKTANGTLETTNPPKDGIRSFKAIPFAEPPVGNLRWQAPQPVKKWAGVRKADDFGPRCMQYTGPNADYWFRSNGMSEDCLYLNVWTSAKPGNKEMLPVLVYVFGGGFQNGDGSEPRYDGEGMARKGMVAVSLNYRTNIFGFFSHPELTKESEHHASGNYGLLDQVAALQWVQENIAAFGGDPKRVTVAGESAGSMSVSALMASPLSRDLMAGAIGESGALISTLPPRPLAQTEKDGARFGELAGAGSLKELRAMSAEKIQEVVIKIAPMGGGAPGTATATAPALRFSPNLDGYFLPKTPLQVFEAGEESKVPLLAGSNSQEMAGRQILGQSAPTVENFTAAIHKLYGEKADDVLKVYAPKNDAEVMQAATDLASARFIAHSTWTWTELQMRFGGRPVYRYFYARARPTYLGMPGQPPPPANSPMKAQGAVHSAEIQYALGTLDLDPRYSWDAEDHKVSETMQSYFVNFIKTGNPNGVGVPEWPAYGADAGYMRIRIDVQTKAEPEPDRARYQVLDMIFAKGR